MSLLDRLEKIRAMAKGGTPEEAAVAMSMLQKALEQHNLTEKDLDRYKVGEIDIKSTQAVSKVNAWENQIMWAVADAFGGHVLWTNGNSWVHYTDGSKRRNKDPFGKFTLVGFKQTLPLMEYAAKFLLRTVVEMRRQKNAGLPADMSRDQKTYMLDGYCNGFVMAVREKIAKLQTDGLIDDYIAEKIGDRPVREVNARDGDYYEMLKGLKDGKAVDLHRPMAHTEQLKIAG